jgi:hypothetical protein
MTILLLAAAVMGVTWLSSAYPVATLIGFFVLVFILVVALMTEEDLMDKMRR